MYNTKFIFSNGGEIYPGYLDKEKRENLKQISRNPVSFS